MTRGQRPGDQMRPCPFCAEQIQDQARKCRFCGEWLGGAAEATRRRPATQDWRAAAQKEDPAPSPPDVAEGAENKTLLGFKQSILPAQPIPPPMATPAP